MTMLKRWAELTPAERDTYCDERNVVECAEQGVPAVIDDAVVLDRVARIVTAPIDERVERAS